MPYHVTVSYDADNRPDTIHACVHWIWKLPANEYINNDGMMACAALFRSIRAGNPLTFEAYGVPTEPPAGLLVECRQYKTETELYWEHRYAEQERFARLAESGAAGNAADAIAACQMYKNDPMCFQMTAVG